MHQQIGRYQVLEEIASGGQGAVYRAFDTQTRQIVALKVLHPSLTGDTTFLERFHREARITASIDNPNVVRIFEVGEDGGRHFISMEFLPESLGRVLERSGGLSSESAAVFAIQIANGLSAAHRIGVVHRDVKPPNVLLSPDGTAKVADFGIARAEVMSTMTATGAVMGTPHYMSPEQCRGDPADARSDVYSLGGVLYQMLTGELPFNGSTPLAVIRQHIEDRPPPIRQLRGDVPSALRGIAERAMEKEPGDRFQSMEEMVGALSTAVPEAAQAMQSAVSEVPSAAQQPDTETQAPSPDEVAARQPRIKPAASGLRRFVYGAAVVVVVSAVVGAFLSLSGVGFGGIRPLGGALPVPAVPAVDFATTSAPSPTATQLPAAPVVPALQPPSGGAQPTAVLAVIPTPSPTPTQPPITLVVTGLPQPSVPVLSAQTPTPLPVPSSSLVTTSVPRFTATPAPRPTATSFSGTLALNFDRGYLFSTRSLVGAKEGDLTMGEVQDERQDGSSRRVVVIIARASWGQRGVEDLGDLRTTPLREVSLAASTAPRDGAEVTVNHVYLVRAREGLGAGYIVLRVTRVGEQDVTFDWLYKSSASPAVSAVPTDGLIAYWPGDGDANDVVGGNNGIMQGNATFGPGVVGQAFSFDRSGDYVQVPDAPNLQITADSPSTLSGWVFPTALPPGFLAVPIEKDFYFELLYNTLNNALRAHVHNGTHWIYLDVPLDLQLNRWTHLAQTWDGEILKVYVNGELEGSGAILGIQYLPVPDNVPLDIGRHFGNTFLGRLDEVAIFNRALSAEEIKAQYDADSAGLDTDATRPISEVILRPDEINMEIGARQAFTVEVLDEFGNRILDALISWDSDPESGTISADGEFTAGTKSGSFPDAIRVDVVKGASRASATADISIERGPLASIKVSPSDAVLDTGVSRQFMASGLDEHGNELSGLAFIWRATGGEIEPTRSDGQTADFAGGVPGSRYEITASAEFKGQQRTGSATVSVAPVWLPTGSMGEARRGHTATMLDEGEVLIVGWLTNHAELYDPASGTFTATGETHFRHAQGATATRLADGRVLIVGGYNGQEHLTSAEIYDPTTGTFTVTGRLDTPRA